VTNPERFLGWLMGLSRHGHVVRPTGTRHIVLMCRLNAVTFSNGKRHEERLYSWTPCSSSRLTTAPDADHRYSGGTRCKRCLAFAATERGKKAMSAA